MKKAFIILLLSLLFVIALTTYVFADDCCSTAPTAWIYYDKDHVGTCSVCGKITTERERHDYTNHNISGCSICGFEPCASDEHIPFIDDSHRCEICHVIFEECPDVNGDGICDMCLKMICEWVYVPYGDGCRLQCTDCKEYMNEMIPHVFDGSTQCLNCGSECTHANIMWENTPEEHFGRCGDCWTVTVEHGAHNTVDGVCTVCGYDGCDHQSKYNMSYNNFGHDLSCALCNEIVVPWSPHEYDANGICTVCGFVGCPHGTLEEAKSVTAYFNASEHWYVCNLCEYAYSDHESHSFENGVCSVCEAKPCGGGQHKIICSVCKLSDCKCTGDVISTTLRLHICSVCNIIAGCTDANGDCRCDYCSVEHHNFNYECTEQSHRVICRSCAFISEWENHYDIDAFVGCDYCSYGKPQAQEKIESAEGAPEVSVELPIGTILSEEEKNMISDGVNVDVTLNISNVDATVSEEDKTAVTTVLQEAAAEQNVAIYLNIDLSKKVGDGEDTLISEINAPITITIDIPSEFQSEGRSFSVVRVHNGTATELPDIDSNPKTVTIETDCFSTYALVYTDKKVSADGYEDANGATDGNAQDSENPNEKDRVPKGVIVAVVSAVLILVLASAAIVIRKKRTERA